MIITRYEVWCDGEPDYSDHNDYPPSGPSPEEARAEARTRGYMTRVETPKSGPWRGTMVVRDYCPEHSDTMT